MRFHSLSPLAPLAPFASWNVSKKTNRSEGGVMEWRKINISCCRCVLVVVVVVDLFFFALCIVPVCRSRQSASHVSYRFFSRTQFARAPATPRWYRRFKCTDNDNDVIVDDVTLICIENGIFLRQTTLAFLFSSGSQTILDPYCCDATLNEGRFPNSPAESILYCSDHAP